MDGSLRISKAGHRRRIAKSSRLFAHTPTLLQFAEPLAGSHEHRFRIGDYRAIFEMPHGTLWVIAIKTRDEARSFNRQTA
jgi:hypothetical protein